MNAAPVAVVGALREAGRQVRVFESQRAPGGRLATRRFAAASFDHGAQYLTAADPRFRSVIEQASAAGAVARWTPDWPERDRDEVLWVGAPAMSALGTRILRLDRARGGWVLLDDRGLAHADFAAVAVALPAPAAAALAGPLSPLAARMRLVPMAPCWAVMVAFDAPLSGVTDAGFTGDPVLAWYARNSSKPGREARESFVLHASPDWSRVEFDQPPQNVQRALLDRFSERVGRALPRVLVADAHRWRHARVDMPLGEDFLLDRDAGLGFCGDWCLEARAEAAWRSGTALGTELAQARGAVASGKIRGSR
jgi:predicted NAD/FAD-dependent oxidoreductase